MPLPLYDTIEAAWSKAIAESLPASRRSTFLAHYSLFPTERDGRLHLRVGVPYRIHAEQLEQYVDALGAALENILDCRALVAFEVDPAVTERASAALEVSNTESEAAILREVQESEIDAAKEAGTIGYYARLLAQVSLPYRPVPDLEWVRRNGSYSLRIVAGSDTGLPNGSLPRILLCHLSTQAVLTRSPQIEVGNCRTDFLRLLGLPVTGGPRGSYQRVNRAMLALANSAIRYRYEEVDARGRTIAGGIHRFDPLEGYDFWFSWKSGDGDQPVLWNSTVSLTAEFFQDLLEHAFPVRMEALRALQGSPLAIDIYVWLTYRMYYLRKPLTLPWKMLEAQFGGTYAATRNFRRDFIRRLAAVRVVYPELRVDPLPGGLRLLPSPTSVRQLAGKKNRHLSA